MSIFRPAASPWPDDRPIQIQRELGRDLELRAGRR
jgi:hypothetical protein